MPVIKSAIKKLRKDKKRTVANNVFRVNVEKAVKIATKNATEKTVSTAFSAIDKAVKKNLIHKNKAARMKSSLTKLLPKKTVKTDATSKKAPVKKPATSSRPKTTTSSK